MITSAHRYCALRILFGFLMMCISIWLSFALSTGVLLFISWAAWIWAFYAIDDVINEYQENISVEERISSWLIMIAVLGLVYWLVNQNIIQSLDPVSYAFFTLLMAGVSLRKWALIRKVPESIVAEDIANLVLFSPPPREKKDVSC